MKNGLPYIITAGILAVGVLNSSGVIEVSFLDAPAPAPQPIEANAVRNVPVASEPLDLAARLAPIEELQEVNQQVETLSNAYAMMEQMFEDTQTELRDVEQELATTVAMLDEMAASDSCFDELNRRAKDYTVFFEVSSTTLSTSEIEKVVAFGSLFRSCPSVVLQVTGHSDAIGDDVANIVLSWERADAVTSVLEASGVDGTKIDSVGFGARVPLAQGDADGDLDRRVEFHVIQKS